MKKIFFLGFILFVSLQSNAQEMWNKVKNASFLNSIENTYKRSVMPKHYKLFKLENSFTSALKITTEKATQIIELPNSEGKFERFKLKEVSNFSPALAAKFPEIKSYRAIGVNNNEATAEISVGTNGMHIIILSGKETLYINPVSKDNSIFMMYKKADYISDKHKLKCGVDDAINKITTQKKSFSKRNASDGKLRTYRLAIVTTGEYSQFHLKQQKIHPKADETVKKGAVLSAINTTMTRVNGIFERDLSIRLELVPNNDKIIYLNPATDNLSNSSNRLLLNESQLVCDREIGNMNYDIGHIFSTGGDGVAQGSSVCVSGQKAKGVTGRSEPIGDLYDVDYVLHEMGHQFGATHTHNNNCNRTNKTAVEPGSGVTIMGYAGICSPNIRKNSYDYFHSVSIDQMRTFIVNRATCGRVTNTGNIIPVANAGKDYNIPKSTPFVLKGSATDPNSTNLTYTWEQMDNGIASMPPRSTSVIGPMFTSLPPSTSPNRYFPSYDNVIAGTKNTWEVLPSVSRVLNFAFVVRDNEAGGGATSRDNMKVFIESAEPFTVATPKTWAQKKQKTVTWTVGKTNMAPINTKKVTIKLSTDNGATFPIILASNTDNDGSELITMPNIADTNNARIMIEAVDNIFYNVTSKFKVTSIPHFEIKNTTGNNITCSSSEAKFKLNYETVNDFSEDTTFSLQGNPAESSFLFSQPTIKKDGTVTLRIFDLAKVKAGVYSMQLTAKSNTKTKLIPIQLTVLDGLCTSKGSTKQETSTTHVKFNTINNTSAKHSGYSNYTTISTEVKKGETYSLSVKVNTASTNGVSYRTRTYAWIDWNQNCILEETEKYDLGTVSGSVNEATSKSPLPIKVPSNAVFGNTKMRITTKFASWRAPTACENNFNGEVEDYRIFVRDSIALVDDIVFGKLGLFPNPSSGKINLIFDVLEAKEVIVKLIDIRGRLVKNFRFTNVPRRFSKELEFPSISKGLYLLQIQNGGKQTTKRIILK